MTNAHQQLRDWEVSLLESMYHHTGLAIIAQDKAKQSQAIQELQDFYRRFNAYKAAHRRPWDGR